MVAVVIDPIVCHTWVGYLLPECWGIAVFQGVWLAAAISAAVTLRSVGAKAAKVQR